MTLIMGFAEAHARVRPPLRDPHLAVDLVDEQESEAILDDCERHLAEG
jgi:hypothetical protein